MNNGISGIFSSKSGYDLGSGVVSLQESVQTKLGEIEFEMEKCKFVAAKIHFKIIKDGEFIFIDSIFQKNKESIGIVVSKLLESEFSRIGKIFGKNILFEFDIFLETHKKKYVWYSEELSFNGSKEFRKSPYVSLPMNRKKMIEHYDLKQSIAKKDKISLFNGKGEFYLEETHPLNQNLDQPNYNKKSSSHKKIPSLII